MGQLRVAPTQTYTLHLLERPLLSAGIISAFLNFPAALWQNTTCPAETLAWLPPQQQPPTLGVSSLWPSHQTEPSSGGEGQGRAGQRGSAGKGSPAQQGSWQGNSCSSRIAQMCFSKSAVRQGRNRPDQIPPPLCLQSPRLARLTQGGCLHLLRMGGGAPPASLTPDGPLLPALADWGPPAGQRELPSSQLWGRQRPAAGQRCPGEEPGGGSASAKQRGNREGEGAAGGPSLSGISFC